MFELKPPEDDGLLMPTVGEWSRDKHYFLMRYIDAFTTAMKGKQWSGLHYIDLFAGAGIEQLENSKELDWGSPLIAAQAPHPFDCLHLCELKQNKFKALKKRVEKLRPDTQFLQGDANDKIEQIIKEIPQKSLSLAFLDPYGLHLDFETLRVLAQKRTDLIIFFPDHLDVVRNWEHNYFDNPDSNLDRCLGKGADWRTLIEEVPRGRLAETLRKLYVSQIRTLGYSHFEYERIYMKGHPLYCLIFCAHHPVAAKIWRGVSGKKPDGQRTFDFE